MKMPFGKYKGKEMETVLAEDPSYIVWLATKVDLRGELKTFVHKNFVAAYNQVELDTEYRYATAYDQWHTDYIGGNGW